MEFKINSYKCEIEKGLNKFDLCLYVQIKCSND